MTYQLDGSSLLFELDRSSIIDISAGDEIEVKGFPDVKYKWTMQDSEFMENNPDDQIFLAVEGTDGNYKAKSIVLRAFENLSR